MLYEPQKIEKKWQDKWEKEKLYQAADFDKKPKFFALIEFPYPSGAGFHVGNARSWLAMDAYSRKKRMQGYNVLFPIGWDAFGLPAENYALKNKLHPSITTAQNIATFKRQIKSLGLSFDWSREINTTDPKYYKWTQWIFLKLLGKGLAYRAETSVNWCPSCKTTLADEEVLADGSHERCDNPTEKRQQEQWILRITKYAQRLLDDLNLVDFSPKIAVQQENWIGKSEGVVIEYPVVGIGKAISCYSTRPDTNFGATFVVVAPEHPLIPVLITPDNKKAIEDYIQQTKKKSEVERIDLEKEKTGVFTGSYALNRLNNRKMPIWVADFAILSAGTGMVVGVPAHDKRDWQFAKKYDLEIVPVVKPENDKQWDFSKEPFVGIDKAKIFNSEFLNGLPALEAKEKIINHLVEKGWGKKSINYHLRDWIFSRQHYWGEPIPVIYCRKCLENEKLKIKNKKLLTTVENGIEYAIIPVPEKDLPVELPYVEKYEPSGTGESPLANIKEWVETTCPNCGGPGRRETDTMPNWAGSNWYYLGYLLINNLGNKKSKIKDKNSNASGETNIFEEYKEQIKYWMPVDIYQGGFEHTTLHLLYSRFIYKFLYDIGVVNGPEPYAKRRSHGIVLGPDNRKMSKSFGNVVNPDEIVAKYGADTLRLYEMFMGPFDQAIAWSEQSLQGCFRFLNRAWRLFQEKVKEEKTPDDILRKLHQTIKKVGEDIENLKFNTMVACLMEFINEWQQSYLSKQDAALFAEILAPSAPHFSEEVWCEILGNKFSVHQEKWPEYDRNLITEETTTIIIQVSGRVRGEIKVATLKHPPAGGATGQERKVQSEVEELAKKEPRVAKYLKDQQIKKVIFVQGRLINFVI
ncbi:MAG: leucine--tRNA ligase [bacterium]|nr:leucine--tRNA ligase [bacterium]